MTTKRTVQVDEKSEDLKENVDDEEENNDALALEFGSDFSLFISNQAPYNRFCKDAVRLKFDSEKFGVVAMVIVTLTAGSCSVERVNSHQKYVMDSKRASMDFRRVNRDMNIRINMKTLRKIRGTSSGSRASKRAKKAK